MDKIMYDENYLQDDLLDNYFEQMMQEFKEYNSDLNDEELIRKAYTLAKTSHSNVHRKSHELYMYHPLRVAWMAIDYHMDAIAICTALLHDVVEDTPYNYRDIKELFGKRIADNVDCVTKLKASELNSQNFDAYTATFSKLFRFLATIDVRGTIIKLFDRLDNMRTLKAVSPEKQLQKSREVLEIFAPIAYVIGANQLKKELQNLAFSYVKPKEYEELKQKMVYMYGQNKDQIDEAIYNINQKLQDEGLENAIKLRIKDLYNTYISLQKGRTLDTIHDLYAIQISLNEKKDCFQALNTIHENYRYLDDKFKDYINNPKTTYYRALHSTFITKNELMIQAQIRTYLMALQNAKGLIYNLRINSREDILRIKKQYPFFETLMELDHDYPDDELFYEKIKYEVLGDKIYVRSTSGKVYSLPVGANIIDFAFLACQDRAPYLDKAYVNGQQVDKLQSLKNQDLVTFTSSATPRIESNWANQATTSIARRLIIERIKKDAK